MKTQFKLTLYLILTNTLMLLLFGGAVYYFLYNYSYNDFYKRLETRASITAKYKYEPNAASVKQLREEHLERLTSEKEYSIELSDSINIEETASIFKLPIAFMQEIIANGKAQLQVDEKFFAGIKYISSDQKEHIIVISALNYYATNHLKLLRNIILIGIAFIILITAYFSFYFSKHIFDPIKQITDKVKQISTDNIHLRLDETANDSEISKLISTFNNLLNRVETAFEIQKNFISNASHEFGTPLTSIMGEAEVSLRKERTPEEYKKSLTSILEQAERINEITQSLLYLAQTGYKGDSISFEIVRTDELLWQVRELIMKLKPQSKIELDFSLLPENPFKLKINGNKQLLTLAFANIITNACKYSNNKPVFVSIASSDNNVIVVCQDQGIGIPESDLPFIYDPFFRASNSIQFEGYGIGLPLTRNIIAAHHGELKISSAVNKGTIVTVKLPLAFL